MLMQNLSVFPLPSPLKVVPLRMMILDWLVAETCGGTHRHRSLPAPWKKFSNQLEVTVTQDHNVGTHPIHTLGGDERGK